LPYGTNIGGTKSLELSPTAYILSDQKVGKKSLAPRNLSEQSQKFLKKIFFNGISSIVPRRQISKWPILKINIFSLRLCEKKYINERATEPVTNIF